LTDSSNSSPQYSVASNHFPAHHSASQTDKELKSSSTAETQPNDGRLVTDPSTVSGQGISEKCQSFPKHLLSHDRGTGAEHESSVITKPEHVQAFYKDSHNHIKASDNNAGWLFAELLGSCVGVVSQKRWVRVRAPFEHHFTRPAASQRSLLFLGEARAFLQFLRKDKESVINVTDDLKYCPFFLVASIFFGPLTTGQRDEMYTIGPLREELFRHAFSGGVNRYSFARYLPGSALPKLRQFQRLWENFVKMAYNEAQPSSGSAIVSLWEAVEHGGISKEEVGLVLTYLNCSLATRN
jgi:hypothetical protein